MGEHSWYQVQFLPRSVFKSSSGRPYSEATQFGKFVSYYYSTPEQWLAVDNHTLMKTTGIPFHLLRFDQKRSLLNLFLIWNQHTWAIPLRTWLKMPDVFPFISFGLIKAIIVDLVLNQESTYMRHSLVDLAQNARGARCVDRSVPIYA
jgi:hypothetical protein